MKPVLLAVPGTYNQDVIRWPSCALCWKIVDEVGIEEETPRYVDVYAKHHGLKDGVRLIKGPFYGPEALSESLRLIAFFAPDSEPGRRVMRVGFVDTNGQIDRGMG